MKLKILLTLIAVCSIQLVVAQSDSARVKSTWKKPMPVSTTRDTSKVNRPQPGQPQPLRTNKFKNNNSTERIPTNNATPSATPTPNNTTENNSDNTSDKKNSQSFKSIELIFRGSISAPDKKLSQELGHAVGFGGSLGVKPFYSLQENSFVQGLIGFNLDYAYFGGTSRSRGNDVFKVSSEVYTWSLYSRINLGKSPFLVFGEGHLGGNYFTGNYTIRNSATTNTSANTTTDNLSSRLVTFYGLGGGIAFQMFEVKLTYFAGGNTEMLDIDRIVIGNNGRPVEVFTKNVNSSFWLFSLGVRLSDLID